MCHTYRQRLFKAFVVVWLGKRDAQQKEALQSLFIWWRDMVENARNNDLFDVVNHFSALLNVSPGDRLREKYIY